MYFRYVVTASLVLSCIALAVPGASAETLARPEAGYVATGALPSRGLSMAQVEQRFGTPVEKLPTAGGDAPRHPPINRWRYAGFTVYFERNRVIHSVPDAAALSVPGA
ncbi:MAG: hypothetical protein J0H15_01355 [Xanthomonadales bacterium]|nr:hypothetical protein [Xanthomonadales bacterium]